MIKMLYLMISSYARAYSQLVPPDRQTVLGDYWAWHVIHFYLEIIGSSHG